MEKQKKKFSFRLTIGNKILGGFLALVILFIINATIIFLTGNSIDNVVKNSSENIRPSKDAINEFVLLVTKSKMLVTNWVYLQTNAEDKQALRDLQRQDYPQLKEELTNLMPKWESDSMRMKMDTVFQKFEALIATQKEIMEQLVTFENYEDPITKLLAEDAIDSQIIPQTKDLITRLDEIVALQTEITNTSDQELIDSSSLLKNITIILSIIIILLAIISAILLVRAITTPVNFLKNIVVKLGNGELVEEKQAKFSNDEIGDMAVAMDNLVNGLKATTLFAESIGKGTYDSSFKPLSDHDVLGNALINMRDNLAKVAEDDKKRNWATEGMARFGELLRTNNDNLDKLADEIIGNLVKYLKANQGAIYIIDDNETEEEPTMSMKACYAWDKKKYLNHKIHKGEGLAGQAWQEGDIIYLTEVPPNYIKITSGLGDANPTSVIIVPLKVNDEIFGIVEIASFNVFKDYETEFVQKIAESIASTISSAKINVRTQRLLEESQEMTEQMRAQEEEMRQNMEELQATQEEVERKSRQANENLEQMRAQEEELRQNMEELNATQEEVARQLAESNKYKEMMQIREDVFNVALILSESDLSGHILMANPKFCEVSRYSEDELVGKPHNIIRHPDMPKELFKYMWDTIKAGNTFRGIIKNKAKDNSHYWVDATIVPVKDEKGKVVKYIGARYLIENDDVAEKLYAAQMEKQFSGVKHSYK